MLQFSEIRQNSISIQLILASISVGVLCQTAIPARTRNHFRQIRTFVHASHGTGGGGESITACREETSKLVLNSDDGGAETERHFAP